MGLKTKNAAREPTLLVYNERKVVGIYCGYFHIQILVEAENGNRQLVGWGYNF